VIVGQANWTLEDMEYGPWSLTFGYLDGKPYYSSKGGRADGEMHLKINISGDTDFIWLCGVGVKESLKHVDIYLDPNVTAEELVNYQPSSRRVEWHHRKYERDECKKIFGIPKGTHVMSLITNETNPTFQTALSHVIMW